MLWLCLLPIAIALVRAETDVNGLQVTNTLNLNSRSFSDEQKSTYCDHFTTHISSTIAVNKDRLVVPVLRSIDTTSTVSFTILPPTTSSSMTTIQVYNAYIIEVREEMTEMGCAIIKMTSHIGHPDRTFSDSRIFS
jgi:hypothetical protein